MSVKNISVQISPPYTSLDDRVIMIDEKRIKQHKIPTNKAILLRLGSARHQVKVISVSRPEGIRMNSSLAHKMNLPYGTTLGIQYRSQTIKLGPVLAVMVNDIRTHSPDRPFGNNTSFCKELIDACQREGIIVYFISPTMLRTSGNSLDGWSYHGRWQKFTFPFPDVVYNRLTSRILENRSQVQNFMRSVKQRFRTKIFNEKYLNKTEVFRALKNVPMLRKYLPESYALRNFTILQSMCRRHAVVFIKPILGSLGKGILRISRRSDGGLVCQSANVKGNIQTFSSTAKLYASLTGKMKVRRYQIQQGLNLITIGSRPVDFRALVQKNQNSQWEVTSIVARIAGNHHFVSNLARGGSLSPVSEALSKAKVPSPRTVHARLRKAAVDIAKGIEDKIPQNFGELGVDLAIDKRSRIWLLEVNSKPSKNDNTPLSTNKIRPSVRQATKYVRHLAGL